MRRLWHVRLWHFLLRRRIFVPLVRRRWYHRHRLTPILLLCGYCCVDVGCARFSLADSGRWCLNLRLKLGGRKKWNKSVTNVGFLAKSDGMNDLMKVFVFFPAKILRENWDGKKIYRGAKLGIEILGSNRFFHIFIVNGKKNSKITENNVRSPNFNPQILALQIYMGFDIEWVILITRQNIPPAQPRVASP